jgi:hypothetical protein
METPFVIARRQGVGGCVTTYLAAKADVKRARHSLHLVRQLAPVYEAVVGRRVSPVVVAMSAAVADRVDASLDGNDGAADAATVAWASGCARATAAMLADVQACVNGQQSTCVILYESEALARIAEARIAAEAQSALVGYVAAQLATALARDGPSCGVSVWTAVLTSAAAATR